MIVGLSPAVGALERDVHAGTDGDGIDVVFRHEADGNATGRPRSGTSSCQWRAQRVTDLETWHMLPAPPQPGPEFQLYIVFCGTTYEATRWLGPANFDDPGLSTAEEILRRVQVSPGIVDVRPESRGITGIPSLFWVEGFTSQPIEQSLTELGATVTVTATLTDVLWDFGDGTEPVHAGLGEAWPQHSSVRHNYANPSTGSGYRVTVTLTLSPSYTVNGGGGGTLAPIVLTFSRDHVVDELQSIRNY